MDLISRQAAIEAVDIGNLHRGIVEALQNIISELPSAQPEQAIKDCRNCKFGKYNDHWNTNFCYCSDDCNNWDKWEPSAQPKWIPCSERLPETSDDVLVTYTVNGKKRRYVETATWYDGDEGSWSSPWDEYRIPGTKVDVIAWMPLPEPYKEETNDPER